ncbi:MAG TPA: hypothetical protein VIT00_11110 [Terrimicrobiaceae bacterium]
MNTKDLIRLGEPIQLAREFIRNVITRHNDGVLLEAGVHRVHIEGSLANVTAWGLVLA